MTLLVSTLPIKNDQVKFTRPTSKVPKYQVLSFTSSKEEIKEAIVEEFGADFAEIVKCESEYEFTALNVNKTGTEDKGLFQINRYYHEKTAKKMGMDLNTIEGQFEYTKILIEKNGYQDWNSSKWCWKNKVKTIK